jgi:hypothetical protein
MLKNLTEEEIKFIKKTYKDKSLSWDERMVTLCEYLGKNERTVRRWCVSLGLKEKKIVEGEQAIKARNTKHDKSKKRFLITYCQNATDVHKEFWKNLLAYAKFIDAQILVIPGRYHNSTGIMDNNEKYEDQEWWDPIVVPYLTLNRHKLNKNLSILSDISVQPTASTPLSSLESLTLNESAIVGHPRVHLKTLPLLDNKIPRLLMSTGSASICNFGLNKAAKIAEFHHIIGAVIVELKPKDEFFARQITATSNGDFIDLYYEVANGKINKVKESLALIKGDIHYSQHSEVILTKSFKNLVPKINPNKILLHDLFDGQSINGHEVNNFVKQYQNEVNGTNSLKKEIENMLNFLDTIKQYNLVVVSSNHDNFLDRFIINQDPKKNIKNALEYLEYAKIVLEGKAPNGLIPYIINQKFKKIKCLGANESFKIFDWELGIHGSAGNNGSKGSPNSFKYNKNVTAHTHSPARRDGSLQVGCNCELRPSYCNGQSSWAHADVIIAQNNKAQHVFYDYNGEFTTIKY